MSRDFHLCVPRCPPNHDKNEKMPHRTVKLDLCSTAQLNTPAVPENLKIEKENMITDINIIKENKIKNMDEIDKKYRFYTKDVIIGNEEIISKAEKLIKPTKNEIKNKLKEYIKANRKNKKEVKNMPKSGG